MTWRGNWWYRFILWLATHVGFGLLGGMRAIHRDRVPRDGPLLIAAVHFSFLDPPLVSCAVLREVQFLAADYLFKFKPFAWLIRSVNAFPVKRGEGDTEAIRKTIEFLQQGKAVLLFPEGTRGDGKNLGHIASGIAMLAKRSQAKILPVGICGTEKSWPKGRKWPKRAKFVVVIGQPFTFEDVAQGIDEKQKRQSFTEFLSSRLVELTQEAGLAIKIGRNIPPIENSPTDASPTSSEGPS